MSALQKRLLLLIGVVLGLQTGMNLVKYALELQSGGRFGGDFICFWQAARHVRAGEIAAIYDPDGWRRLVAAGRVREFDWFVYPPFALIGLWPLGRLSYGAAVLAWSLAPLPAYFGLVQRLARRAGLGAEATMCAAALALPFLSANLFSGQTGAVVAVLFLAAAWLWPDRPILAGVLVGLMAIKPQLGLLLPFALAAAGRWRTIAAAAATVLGLAAAATLWLGPAVWADYARMTGLFGEVIGHGYGGLKPIALGPYGALRAAGAPLGLAAAVQGVVSLAVLAAVVRAFRRSSAAPERLDPRLGALAVGALLATPYSLVYDTPLLIAAILPLLARAWREGWDSLDLAAMTALVVLPFATPLAMRADIPFGPLALLLAFVALHRRAALVAARSTSESRQRESAGAPILAP
jgi:hypothetical protein